MANPSLLPKILFVECPEVSLQLNSESAAR